AGSTPGGDRRSGGRGGPRQSGRADPADRRWRRSAGRSSVPRRPDDGAPRRRDRAVLQGAHDGRGSAAAIVAGPRRDRHRTGHRRLRRPGRLHDARSPDRAARPRGDRRAVRGNGARRHRPARRARHQVRRRRGDVRHGERPGRLRDRARSGRTLRRRPIRRATGWARRRRGPGPRRRLLRAGREPRVAPLRGRRPPGSPRDRRRQGGGGGREIPVRARGPAGLEGARQARPARPPPPTPPARVGGAVASSHRLLDTGRVSLLELSDLNYAEALRDLSRRAGGAVHDEDGLMLYASPHPLPVMTNGAFRTEARLSASEVLDRAREFFARHERGFTVHVRAHADGDLRAAAEAAGLLLMGDLPGMVLDHRLPDVVVPPGVVLRRVETEEDAVAFGAVMGGAYATYGMPTDVAPMTVGRLGVLRAPHI